MDIKLPTHPVWGRAIGHRRNGAPIYLIQGGSGEGEPPAGGGQGDGTTPPEGSAPPTGEDPGKGSDGGDLGEGGKKALEAERKLRADAEKAQRAAEAKLKAIEDANKTEEQRREERMRQLEKDAAKATRYEAANAAGLPLSMAGRLVGDTPEELAADAEALKAELAGVKPADDTPPKPPTPKPDRRQGGGSTNATGGSMAAGRDEYRARKQQNTK
ncbi:hypothetical protein IRT45_34490 [Nocardia sp. BSTN01]|uniref:hypothetical protein n=1 Tax=Nocardia sp. BSTN01 TaxID=2783665 RepID=UPI00188E1562|nr:hypothetical protein [Nocardia sp. BSTN01]MBF5002228.1 hypothetical protein [Nocardia sp. BSTN01]